jgi:succinate dehydrogenase / fumarate reductase iron-sulfur subunit
MPSQPSGSKQPAGVKPVKGKNPVPKEGHLPINEFLGELQGANSPFGDDIEFPLSADRLDYTHPDPKAPVGSE